MNAKRILCFVLAVSVSVSAFAQSRRTLKDWNDLGKDWRVDNGTVFDVEFNGEIRSYKWLVADGSTPDDTVSHPGNVYDSTQRAVAGNWILQGGQIKTFDTYALLRAEVTAEGRTYRVRGRLAIGDNGQGTYRDVGLQGGSVDDGGYTIITTSGRKLQRVGRVEPKHFGATPYAAEETGVTIRAAGSDDVELQAWFDSHKNEGATLTLDGREQYKSDNTLLVSHRLPNIKLDGTIWFAKGRYEGIELKDERSPSEKLEGTISHHFKVFRDAGTSRTDPHWLTYDYAQVTDSTSVVGSGTTNGSAENFQQTLFAEQDIGVRCIAVKESEIRVEARNFAIGCCIDTDLAQGGEGYSSRSQFLPTVMYGCKVGFHVRARSALAWVNEVTIGDKNVNIEHANYPAADPSVYGFVIGGDPNYPQSDVTNHHIPDGITLRASFENADHASSPESICALILSGSGIDCDFRNDLGTLSMLKIKDELRNRNIKLKTEKFYAYSQVENESRGDFEWNIAGRTRESVMLVDARNVRQLIVPTDDSSWRVKGPNLLFQFSTPTDSMLTDDLAIVDDETIDNYDSAVRPVGGIGARIKLGEPGLGGYIQVHPLIDGTSVPGRITVYAYDSGGSPLTPDTGSNWTVRDCSDSPGALSTYTVALGDVSVRPFDIANDRSYRLRFAPNVAEVVIAVSSDALQGFTMSAVDYPGCEVVRQGFDGYLAEQIPSHGVFTEPITIINSDPSAADQGWRIGGSLFPLLGAKDWTVGQSTYLGQFFKVSAAGDCWEVTTDGGLTEGAIPTGSGPTWGPDANGNIYTKRSEMAALWTVINDTGAGGAADQAGAVASPTSLQSLDEPVGTNVWTSGPKGGMWTCVTNGTGAEDGGGTGGTYIDGPTNDWQRIELGGIVYAAWWGTDDTAIQAAIDHCGTSGTVVLDPIAYDVDATILINRGIRLMGTGRSNENLQAIGTVLDWDGSGTDVVLQIGDGTLAADNPTHGWTIENLSINGNSTTGCTGLQIGTGLEANNKSQSGTLENLYVSGCPDNGIRCYNAQLCSWDQVHVNACGVGVNFAYFLGSGNTSQTINSLRVSRCTSALGGLRLEHLTSSVFRNCYTELNQYNGIVMDAVDPACRINVKFDAYGSEANNQATRKSVDATFANATEIWTSTAHGYVNDDRVYLETTSALPTGYNSTTKYYVVGATANTLQLSLTSGGGAVDGTTDGTGIQKVIANGTGASQVKTVATAPVTPLTDRNRPKVTFNNPRVSNTAIGDYEFDLSGFSVTLNDPECEEGSIVTQSSTQETRAYVNTKYDPQGTDQPIHFTRTMVLTDASGDFDVGETIVDDDDSTLTGDIVSQSGTAPNLTIRYRPTGGAAFAATGTFTASDSGVTATSVAMASPATNLAECFWTDHDSSMARTHYTSTSAANAWQLGYMSVANHFMIGDRDDDNTVKNGRLVAPAYDTDPAIKQSAMMIGLNTNTDNILNIGGGSSAYHAAEQTNVYAAANQATPTGTMMHQTTTAGFDLLTNAINNIGEETHDVTSAGLEDLSPSVDGVSVLRVDNTTGGNITNFDNPTDGQLLIVSIADGVTGIADGTNIDMLGTAYTATASGAGFLFVYDLGEVKWKLISRTDSVGGAGGPSTPVSTTNTALVLWDGTDGSALLNTGITVSGDEMTFPNNKAIAIGGGAAKVTIGSALNVLSTTGLKLANTAEFEWSSTASGGNPADTGIARKAASEIRVTDGSTGNGIIAADQLKLLERSSNPPAPAEGESIIFMSNGTALGDDGDVFNVTTAGGSTTYTQIHDHSAGTTYP